MTKPDAESKHTVYVVAELSTSIDIIIQIDYTSTETAAMARPSLKGHENFETIQLRKVYIDSLKSYP